MEFVTESAEDTKKLGKKLAADLIAESKKPKAKSNIFALTGDLGAGKTTFVQGFAEGLEIKNRIISPTFILLRKYSVLNAKHNLQNLYHVDLYRLENNVESEVENLGLYDIWKDPKNVVLIEWAEKIDKILPNGTKHINFEILEGNKRKITID